jgi:hypothetical protein
VSYQNAHYGLGFDVSRANWSALRFEALAKRRGRDITITIRTPIGRDNYGNQLYTEKNFATKGFVEGEDKEVSRQAGDTQEGDVVAFIPIGAAAEPGWEFSIQGIPYIIRSVTKTPTFTKIKAGRKETS